MAWQQVKTFKQLPDGRVIVNPAKQFIQPFELSIDRPNRDVTIAALDRRGPFPLSARFDGPIEVFYLKAIVTDQNGATLTDYNIDFLLEHPGKRIQFMPRPVPLIAAVGDAGRPYILPETIFIPAVQSLNITFFNQDNAERTVEFVMGCIKYYFNSAPVDIRKEMAGYTERRERTYTYFLPLDTDALLSALQTDAERFSTIPDDADIEIFKLTCHSDGDFRVQLRDGTNDRAITSQKIRASLLFGGHVITPMGAGIGGSGGMFPYRWPTSFLARRSTQIAFVFDDLSNSVNLVQPILGGRKVRYG